MFDRESLPTITESVEQSADSTVELADSATDSAANPVKICLWVRALSGYTLSPHALLLLPFVIRSANLETP